MKAGACMLQNSMESRQMSSDQKGVLKSAPH